MQDVEEVIGGQIKTFDYDDKREELSHELDT